MKQRTALLLLSALGITALIAGAAPATAQSPAPPITIQGAPADGDWGGAPAEVPAPAAKPPPAAPAKKKSAEVLPWADKPLEHVTPTGDLAALEAAAAQCSGLFEAACRDLKTCAWVADLTLEDGTEVPARCAARRPAPPKKAAKKATPAKVTAKAADAPAAAPAQAVKASVTSVEDEPPQAKAEAEAKPEPKPKPEPKKAAAIEPPEAPKEPKMPTIAEPKAPEAPAQADGSVAPEEKQAAKAPIVVKPPPPAATSSPMPSFGSMSPNMGGMGMGNAVVVTVPPPSQ